MKIFCFLLALGLLFGNLNATEDCDESGVCKIPGTASGNDYAALSPIGKRSIKFIKQAPRLSSLNGKRIAIVGGSFMASVTHPEIKRLLQKDYPDTTIYVLKEIGSAGPWPGPGVIRRQKDEFVENLKRLKIDAVISGNGGCGLCTPKEMGSCIAAEYSNIPAVMIAAPGFTTQAAKTARNAGIMIPRIAVYPGAFSAHSREELLKNRKILAKIAKIVKNPIGGFVKN